MDKDLIKIGTRGSALALAQTELVIEAVKQKYPSINTSKVIIKTKGDIEKNKPVPSFGNKGVFSMEIEEALLDGRIDMAVHSAKDLPYRLKDGLSIQGVLKREDARDVFITRKGTLYKDLLKKEMISVGTGSLRRRFQFRFHNNVEFMDIRGNIETRINKLRNGLYDGIILAAAGLKRLKLCNEKDLEYKYFSVEDIVPAGGQGIIAIETRTEDTENNNFIKKIAGNINDKETFFHFNNERKIIKALDAGCNTGLGVISFFFINDGEEMLRIKTSMNFANGHGIQHSYCGTGDREDADELIAMAIEHGKKKGLV